MSDVDGDVIRSAVAQVYSDDPRAPIRSVDVMGSEKGLRIFVRMDGAYEDTERRFDAHTGEELVEN